MITAQDAALQRARAYVRDRGWRHEPLTWEEVEVLVGLTYGPDLEDFNAGYEEGYAAGLKAGRTKKVTAS
jgi:hypothetical protein